MTPAAIGFADHTGWAIAVAVAGAGLDFNVVHRERIRIVDPSLPAQAYHAVTERGMPPSIIDAVRDSALACATAEIGRIVGVLVAGEITVTCAGIPVGTAAVPDSREAIFKRHTLWHAAEGDLYREALSEGAARAGLQVLRLPRKEIGSIATATDGWDAGWLTEAGHRLGPPWQADHKLAATAAWYALAMTASKARQPTHGQQ